MDFIVPPIAELSDHILPTGCIVPLEVTTISVFERQAHITAATRREKIPKIITVPAICAGRSIISSIEGMKSYLSSLSCFLLCFRAYSVSFLLSSIYLTPLLLIVEISVKAVLRHELFVCVVLHKVSLVYYHYLLRVLES